METKQDSKRSSEMAVNAEQVDFRSQVNGRDYRLFISVPGKPAPEGGYPVVYLIDGNLHFGIAVDTARIQACWPDVRDPVIVGIGYQTDSVAAALQLRMIDLTTPTTTEWLDNTWIKAMKTTVSDYGGMDDYLRVIDEDVKPRVAAMASINAQDQTLMGHSLGGLTTLHALFRRTASFQQFVAISPSIWWDDGAVLKHEAAFVQRARAGEVNARALISVGEEEAFSRYVDGLSATKEDFEAMAKGCRMVDNVVELGERLAPLNSPKLKTEAIVHLDDDHNTVVPAGIARGIRFTMRRP